MKNIHVLPTDKSSRLSIKDSVLILHRLQWRKGTQNIYITSDEEIKEGDWCYHPLLKGGSIIQSKFDNPNSTMKKIILTTDQDLIKDGVQAIDDEFLEWFVKNPSCEYVDLIGLRKEKGYEFLGYEIIIPTEEPYERTIQSISLSEVDKEELRQETLEEVAERLYPNYQQEIFIKGAKWQSERMYSEEDLKQFAFECVGNFLSNRENELEIELVNVISDRNNKLFEKFKKK